PEVPGYVAPAPRVADPALIEAAVRTLLSARRPLILAGDGVLHAGATALLGSLARRLHAPVITTVLGKGALPETDPWSLGDMTSAPGSEGYGAADLLLAIGTRFVQVDTRWNWFRPPRRLIHVDADEREIGRVLRPEIGIAADPGEALAQLNAALGEHEATA